mmetsp:Transcript_37381/g.81399  ORF Transcript_37381/g.81399 Transcript_37381/m.81399 type:complete len:305 (+) Transcript_37381:113-1027(+)
MEYWRSCWLGPATVIKLRSCRCGSSDAASQAQTSGPQRAPPHARALPSLIWEACAKEASLWNKLWAKQQRIAWGVRSKERLTFPQLPWHSTAELLLVQAPRADRDRRVRLGGRNLALLPEAERRADLAAEDAVDDGGLEVLVATAAEALALGAEEAVVHLGVDAASAADEVVEPEGLVHDLALIEEGRLPLRRAHGAAKLLVADGAGRGVLERGDLHLLLDAQADLHRVAEAVIVHDVRGRRGAADAELLDLSGHEGIGERSDALPTAAAVDQPLGVIDHLGAGQLRRLGTRQRRHRSTLSENC